MSAAVIRFAREDDVPGIAALEKLCFSDAWSEEAIRSPILQPEAFFAMAATDGEGGVIGWICVSCVLDEAEICSVAAHPAHRREGIGSSLLRAALTEAKARGAVRAFLDVREHNAAANAMYLKFGFLPFGRRRRYYRDPTEDAIVMGREL